MAEPLASMGVLLEQISIEREAHLRHVEALDSKAGVVLGIASAVAALAAPTHTLVSTVGRAVAVGDAILALLAFLSTSISNFAAARVASLPRCRGDVHPRS